MKHLTFLILVAALFSHAPSRADVWLCKRGDLEEYTNVGNTKDCRKLNLPGITTVPAARASAGSNRVSVNATPARPAEFPKVEGSAQRARDDDRRKLLEEELKEQETRLAELRRSPGVAQGSDHQAQISRAEANIASLKRELSRVTN